MEIVKGVTVIHPDAGGASSEAERGPVVFGPNQNADACVAWVGAMPAGDPGPPLHIHPDTDEAFYIADGELTFSLGNQEVVAPAGSFVFVPRGIVHTARNSGSGPMRGMLILSPGSADHITEAIEQPG